MPRKKRIDTYVPIMIDDIMSDECWTEWSNEEFGIYMKLLIVSWSKPRTRLSKSMRILCRIIGVSRPVKALSTALSRFETDGDEIYNEKMLETRKFFEERSLRYAENGKQGAEKRWKTDSNANGKTDSKNNDKRGGERYKSPNPQYPIEDTNVSSRGPSTGHVNFDSIVRGIQNQATIAPTMDNLQHADDLHGLGIAELAQVAASCGHNESYNLWYLRLVRINRAGNLESFREDLRNIWFSRRPDLARHRGIKPPDSEIRVLMRRAKELSA